MHPYNARGSKTYEEKRHHVSQIRNALVKTQGA
jgi:hypothetical protein